MKNRFLIIFLLICGITFSQTEKETLDFLNGKLRSCSSSIPRPDGSKAPTIFSIEPLQKNNRTVFEINLRVDGPFEENIINPENVSDVVERRGGNGKLHLRIIDKEGAVLRSYVEEEGKNWVSHIDLVLNCPDEEVRRIQKGLIHLFQMNGANLVNDDLFRD